MSLPLRPLLHFVLAMLLVVVPSAAPGQALEPEVTATLSANEVEVGEPFTVELKALAEQGAPAPGQPELRAPSGFEIEGPRLSTQSYMQIVQGRVTSKTGLGASWTLVASREGTFTLPGPSVVAGGRRIATRPLTVRVVPATGRKSASRPGTGMLPWPGFFGRSPLEELFEREELPERDDLALPAAPDRHVFLRAVVDRTSAVVGEQVTLSLYLYRQVDLELKERRDPPLADFVRHPLVKNPEAEPTALADVGGERWKVNLLHRYAIFPLRTGDLSVGAATVAVATSRRHGPRLERRSNDVVIAVREPPLAGRPPGYQVGDVGRYTMTATVQPRTVEAGGAIGVSIQVSGTGHVPASVRVPARTGVEWLEPERREQIDAGANHRLGGSRTFGYVVRLREPGEIDLGAVSLPYWDAERGRYEVASAALGKVRVLRGAGAPGSAAAASAEPERPDPFATLPPARAALRPYRSAPRPWTDTSGYWVTVGGAPLGVLAATGAAHALAAYRRRRKDLLGSAAAAAERALSELEGALRAAHPEGVAAAAERAVYLAVEAATGFRARAALLGDLAAELGKRGVSEELAAAVTAVLREAEAVRFDPTAGAGSVADLGRRAREAARTLLDGAGRR